MLAVSRRIVLTAAIMGLHGVVTSLRAQAAGRAFVVYRSSDCQCCEGWVAHMIKAGYQPQTVRTDDLSAVRRRLQVPADLAGCHTAVIGGYVIEGHVPSEDVTRFLRQPPAAALGLAVPRMPVGSPGMERPDGMTEQFFTLLLLQGGRRRIFVRHP
ncbi:MAG: DUF411 domain-containing protein [Phenylobacterium sp.]|jgi:hypothetical protein|nr:DUF411 domain-containing protein [Phenylobacterium sp.]